MFDARMPLVMSMYAAAVDRAVDDSRVEVAASAAAVARTAAERNAHLVTDQLHMGKIEDSRNEVCEERHHSQVGDSLGRYPATMGDENLKAPKKGG